MDNFNLNNIFQNYNFGLKQQNISPNNQPTNFLKPELNSLLRPNFALGETKFIPTQETSKDLLINPNMLYNLKMAKMDNKEVTKYLQNILKVPNEIEEFVKNNQNILMNPIKDVKDVKNIVENMLNLKFLSIFLNDSSKEAMQKVLHMMSNAIKTGIQPEQLKEMVSILSSISQNVQANSQNSLKELFLIYIPVNYQNFNKELEFNPSDYEESKIEQSDLSLIFETINFSNVLCVISEENQKIYIDAFCASNFPSIKLKSILSEKVKKYNFILDYEFNKRKNEYSGTEQNFKIVSNNYVSIKLLLLAHKIIETVFELDNIHESI